MQPAPWSPPHPLLRPPRQQPAIFGREERILLRDSMSAAYDHRTSEDWLASQTANSLGKSKLILTGDLFNTVTTAEHLKETLRSFLGHRTNLKALWIHDARGGWHPIAVARGWMLDGFGELESLAQCGISKFDLRFRHANELELCERLSVDVERSGVGHVAQHALVVATQL